MASSWWQLVREDVNVNPQFPLKTFNEAGFGQLTMRKVSDHGSSFFQLINRFDRKRRALHSEGGHRVSRLDQAKLLEPLKILQGRRG